MPTFFTPLLLLGGLLVAVPILLHLVMRERPKHLTFPALQFIRQRREANRRRLRVRHLLLLLLRCAAIVLLAVALARPVFQSMGSLSGHAPVAAAVAFDTRPRMNYRHHNKSRLDSAKKMGLEILENLPAESELVFLDCSGSRSRFDVDRGAVAQRIEGITAINDSPELIRMVDNALRVLRNSDKDRKEVYLFTDMANADWQSGSTASSWQRRIDENPDIDFYLIDVGIQKPQNFALGDLKLSQEVVSESDHLHISTEIFHVGTGGEQTVQLYLLDENGTEVKKGEKVVQCREGESALVEFPIAIDRTGIVHGLLQLARSDNLEIDNKRFFTVRVNPPPQVLIAAPEPVQSHSRKLAMALAPPTLRRRGDAQFEVEVMSYDQLEDQPLDSYNAIWLLDPPPLSAKLWNGLSGYVDAGGGLAIVLGSGVGATPERFNSTVSLELLPAELKRQWRHKDLYLAPASLEHPLLQPFKDKEGQIPWQENRIFKSWQLEELPPAVRVIVPYSNGQPALISRELGQGRTVVLTTSLTSSGHSSESPGNSWNDLLSPRENAWPGILLVNAITEYLVGSAGWRLNYDVNDLAELELDSRNEYASFLLTTPNDSRRVVPDENGRHLLVSGTEVPGHYQLGAGGRQGVQYGFSVNVPSAATVLNRMTPDEFNESYDPKRLPVVTSVQELSDTRKVTAARTRWEAYPWLMMVLAIVVASEGLMATFFYRQRKTEVVR